MALTDRDNLVIQIADLTELEKRSSIPEVYKKVKKSLRRMALNLFKRDEHLRYAHHAVPTQSIG